MVRSVEIERDARVVRQQFADVAHHAANGVHRGVTFEVLDDDGSRCRYRQVSRVGPLAFRQELTLEHAGDGPLVNRIIAEQFTGGAITFVVQPLGPGRSVVEARLVAPLAGVMRGAAPLLRTRVGKQLAAALAEDKDDLERGDYGLT